MSDRLTWTADGRPLIEGAAVGRALVLDEPLSFWGGLDPATGRIIDRRHPQAGEDVSGRVLVMPSGRGSSSSSTVVAEAVRTGRAPAAIVLREADPIIVVGALVAGLVDGLELPVVVLETADYERLRTGDAVTLARDGRICTNCGTGV